MLGVTLNAWKNKKKILKTYLSETNLQNICYKYDLVANAGKKVNSKHFPFQKTVCNNQLENEVNNYLKLMYIQYRFNISNQCLK
jgi:hypothetical protein